MNKNILNTVIQDFINSNLNSDIARLLFQDPTFDDVSIKEIVDQIEAKKKCKDKLPTWYQTSGIYFPNKLNIEQTSSEVTAAYKSLLISGTSLIDLTGGFGVDAFFFSKRFEKVIHCEIDNDLSNIVRHNYDVLGTGIIETKNHDGIEYIVSSDKTYDWIYVDPSRRHDIKGKVFVLGDCLPDVPEHLDALFDHSDNIMIKTSPLLDIKAGLKELSCVKEIHIVTVQNEVKELLWVLKKGYSGMVTIRTVNLLKEHRQVFEFQMEDETKANVRYSEPLTYLYEPNSGLLKSGAFKLISETLGVYKLHRNSHLYTSETLIDFPGRRFKIEKILPYNKKLLKKEFMYKKVNVSIRNFSESVEQLKKKFDLRDGGTIYLFFTTDVNEQRIVLVCSKV